jgi:hypothetical protein
MQPTKKGLPRKHRFDTKFSQIWGILPSELAQREDIGIDAIHMRVHKWGTPWRRKARPSQTEIMFGRTTVDLAREHGIHPISVQHNVNKYGTPVHPNPSHIGQWNKGAQYGELHWSENKKYKNVKEWLMPEHPDYELFKNSTHQQRLTYLIDQEIL